MGTLKAAVIGLGVMGRHHARVYRSLPEIESVMAIDPDPDANRAARDQGLLIACWDVEPGFNILSEDDIRIVSITVPTSLHASMAIRVMELGGHVLVEKPIAHTIKDAQDMIDCAKMNDCILMVGHIVRYDRITQFVRNQVLSGELGGIWRISSRRIGPAPDRIRDVGVTVDLATHDIDAMRWILGQDPWEVGATVRHRDHGNEQEDQVDGWIEFDGGATGIIEADWLTPIKHRSMVVCGSKGMLVADYVRRTVIVSKTPTVRAEWGFPTHGSIEPLKDEIMDFVTCVIVGNKSPISGNDGLVVLRTALMMVESSNTARRLQL